MTYSSMNCRHLLAATLSVCAMVGFAAEARAEDRLVFGVLNVAPFSIQDKAKPTSGLYVELLGTIIEHAKVDATIELFPLARVLAQLKGGSVAATLAIPNPEILEIGTSAAEVVQLDSIAVGLKGARIGAFEDLQGKNVCLLRGSSFAPRLREDSRVQKTELPDYESCIRMLRAGRVDFIAAPRVGMWWNVRIGTIDQSELGEPFILSRRPVHLLVSKRVATAALLNSLAEGVRLAKADGSIDAIAKRFGQQTIKEQRRPGSAACLPRPCRSRGSETSPRTD
jgi:ABC-type amino acid transport substrate-binding protein